MTTWANVISYTLNIAFGLVLLYPFSYIALTGRYLHEPNRVILYGEMSMAIVILVFGVTMVARKIRGQTG